MPHPVDPVVNQYNAKLRDVAELERRLGNNAKLQADHAQALSDLNTLRLQMAKALNMPIAPANPAPAPVVQPVIKT